MADIEKKEDKPQAQGNEKEDRLQVIQEKINELSERLSDLQQQFFKGKLSGPECDRMSISMRKQRKKLVEEKYNIIGGIPHPDELGDDDDDDDDH